jgi:hypothetical protein
MRGVPQIVCRFFRAASAVVFFFSNHRFNETPSHQMRAVPRIFSNTFAPNRTMYTRTRTKPMRDAFLW